MSKTENIRKAQRAASSPAARKKAVETMKRRRQEKEEARAREQAQLLHNNLAHVPDSGVHMSIDDIPDREPRKKYAKRSAKLAPYDRGHMVSEDEWMFLQLAKRLLRGMK